MYIGPIILCHVMDAMMYDMDNGDLVVIELSGDDALELRRSRAFGR